MSYNYVVTANRASAVTRCVRGSFTGPDDTNLITAKLSRIEISKVTPEGLKPVREVGVYGRIDALELFRPPGYNKDLMFMLTSKYDAAILECIEGSQPDSIEIITLRSGNIADPASRAADIGNIVIIDPDCKVIGLRLYDGLFKVIPIERNKSGNLDTWNVRMEETNVPSITFLYGFANPTIGFIYKDSTGASHIRTYEISMKEKEFLLGPWRKDNIANDASIIIPVPEKPFGGAIVIALESIVYINGDVKKVVAPSMMKESAITCYTRIDNDRFLLGDSSGKLFHLELEASDYRDVKDIKLTYLGEVSIPHCLTYLDNSIVYVGSKFGDSQLIRLFKEPDETGSFISVCENYTNLGPISDMCLVDLEKQGQGQLVTCSGYAKEGSLRIIRNGIGINEHASTNMPDVVGIWALRLGKCPIRDTHIFVSFQDESYLLQSEPDGNFQSFVREDGFDRSQRTKLCANVSYNQVIQVTGGQVRLICASELVLIAQWSVPGSEYPDRGIDKVCHNHDEVVCASRSIIYYLKIEAGRLELSGQIALENQIACVDISPLVPECKTLALGFWFNMDIVIYQAPGLKEICREKLNSEMVPRSILTAKLEDNYYLLCALADGSVHYFNFDPIAGTLSNYKRVILGTYEAILRPFKSQSTTSIFVCSDRPTVIYSSNNKLVFSNVNLKEVNHMCPLDTEVYRDSLALVSDSDILFGTIDEIQKLHIRAVPLQETPLRIAHQQSTQTFGLLTMRKDFQCVNGMQPLRQSASTLANGKSSAVNMTTATSKPVGITCADIHQHELEICNFLIVDQHTFEVVHAHQFMPSEHATSILSTRLGETSEEYFVVGTAFVNQDEPEPRVGRLIVFKWTNDSSLQQVAELSVKGCPYSLCEFDNKFLAGVNASVILVELNSRRDLHVECTYVNATVALFLKRRGNLVLMGDLMRSMSLFAYKPMQSHFEELARDSNPAWMTEIEILDEDTFLGAEYQYNLFVCKRDSKATCELDKSQLHQVGLFHLGDSVNVFHPGTLVVQHPSESSIDVKRATLFGTVEGVVGLILSIDEQLYNRLEAIQNALCKIIRSVGRIDHKDWREFTVNRLNQSAIGFVDGDLIEAFLDLSREKMELIAKDVDESVEDMIKMIEELNRLH